MSKCSKLWEPFQSRYETAEFLIVLNFEFLSFDVVSDFGFRISIFKRIRVNSLPEKA
jgi:hypothetical protein